MNPFIANPKRLLRNVRDIGRLGADARSRARLHRDMVRANLRGLHDGWTNVANRLLGTAPIRARLRLSQDVDIWYRPGTTDLMVVEQVFVGREYDVEILAALDDVRYIVDLGSNIGLTALFFGHRFPRAELLLVEADRENFELLERNIAPLGARVHAECAAVSDHDGPIFFHKYNREYGHSLIRRKDYGTPVESVEVPGLTIDSLAERAGFPRIDLLKMDIEGSEAILMPGIASWTQRPRAIVAELHDPYDFETFSRHCAKVGLRAIAPGASDSSSERGLPWAVDESLDEFLTASRP